AITSGQLFWNGPAVVGANGAFAKVYAPNPYEGGSSVSHWDTSFVPDQLLEPFYTGPNHNPGLTTLALVDMGWGLAGGGSPTATPTAGGPTPTQTRTPTPTATSGKGG